MRSPGAIRNGPDKAAGRSEVARHFLREIAQLLPPLILPGEEFRYNPVQPGEMAEWLKAAVC
jgi:hypothetical protein